MGDILRLAKEIQFNSKLEAEALENYTRLLNCIEEVNPPDKEEITALIKEIISDELNHSQKLFNLYLNLTKIKPNID